MLTEVEVRFSVESDLPPEAVLAAAVDFSDRRPEIWKAIDPQVYRVHSLGETTASVTEGSAILGGIWALERYDWATPGRVRAEVEDSNVFRQGSTWEMHARPRPGGGSVVEWISRRRARGPKGRLLVLMMRLGARRALERQLRRTLALIAPDPVS